MCQRYGLAGEAGEEGGAGGYREMQEVGGRPEEATLMHLHNYSLLYCWIHKVILSQNLNNALNKKKNSGGYFCWPPSPGRFNFLEQNIL